MKFEKNNNNSPNIFSAIKHENEIELKRETYI